MFVRPGSPEFEALLTNNQGERHRKDGEYDLAEPLLIKASRLWQQIEGRQGPHLGVCLWSLALVYVASGRFEEAVPLVTRSVEIAELQGDPSGMAPTYRRILDALLVNDPSMNAALQEGARKIQ